MGFPIDDTTDLGIYLRAGDQNQNGELDSIAEGEAAIQVCLEQSARVSQCLELENELATFSDSMSSTQARG